MRTGLCMCVVVGMLGVAGEARAQDPECPLFSPFGCENQGSTPSWNVPGEIVGWEDFEGSHSQYAVWVPACVIAPVNGGEFCDGWREGDPDPTWD